MSVTEKVKQHVSLTRYSGLDGLRGVAVIMVIIFHSGLDWLPGGFLGVSVFFTLSGFLITSLLINECENTGGLNLKSFWGRRLRRLAPASLVVIACIVGFASWLSTSIEAGRIKGDAISAVLYFSNWRFIYSGHSYGELFASPSPLQHVWSLSIEEQLYVVVPLAVVGLYALGLRRRGIGIVMLTAVGVSTIATVVTSDHELIYYATHTRAAELLLGSALACLLGPALERSATKTHPPWATFYLFPFLGVLALARFSTVNSPWVYSGALTLFAVCSALCIVGAIQHGPLRNFLSLRPLVQVGHISYGLYLIHWPVIVWLNSDRLKLHGITLFALQVIVSLALAVMSYWFIEQPIRQRKILQTAQGSLSVLVLAIVGSIVLTTSVLASNSSQVDTAPDVLATVAPTTLPVHNATTTSVVGAQPELVDRSVPLNVLVIGDSTAENIATALAAASDGSLGVISAGVLGCPLLQVAIVRDREDSQQDVSYCPNNLQLVRESLLSIDAVVIVAGVAQQWAYQEIGSDMWIEPGSEQYILDLNSFLLDIEQSVAPQGLPVLVFETPAVRDNPRILGDEIASLVRWAQVIQHWDSSWHSVKTIAYADTLSDPNTAEGKIERPDGVHLAEGFGEELARAVLIPRLRKNYFDALDEMNSSGCRRALDQSLDVRLCRLSE
ncbi:MAG: acyltransferase family protein [Actinomycetes bacterium]